MKRPILGVVLAVTLVLAACGSGVDEAASGTVIGKIEQSELGSGESASATFDLSPGKYVLICNIAGHYKDGMYAGFTVNSLDDSKSATVGVKLVRRTGTGGGGTNFAYTIVGRSV